MRLKNASTCPAAVAYAEPGYPGRQRRELEKHALLDPDRLSSRSWMAPFSGDSPETPVWHLDAARGPSTPSFNHLIGKREQFIRTVRPSALAVLRLITNSNLFTCSTGKSAGCAPFKILS